MGPTPLWPARTFSHTWSVPMPKAQTNPTPVTTTRLLNVEISPGGIQRGLLLGLSVFIDIGDGVLDGGDFLGVLVRNLDAKTLFKSHDELHGVEGVGTKVVHEGRGGSDFGFIDPQLLDNDLLDAFFDAGHSVFLR